MNMRTFFDLSKPVEFFDKRQATEASRVTAARSAPAALATETGAFEVGMPAPSAAPARPAPPAFSAASRLTLAWQVAIYMFLILSIISSRFLDLYRAGVLGQFSVDGPYLVFTAIASLMAFPIVYDRAQLNQGRPILVQIGLVFAAGMGWEKLIATAIGK